MNGRERNRIGYDRQHSTRIIANAAFIAAETVVKEAEMVVNERTDQPDCRSVAKPGPGQSSHTCLLRPQRQPFLYSAGQIWHTSMSLTSFSYDDGTLMIFPPTTDDAEPVPSTQFTAPSLQDPSAHAYLQEYLHHLINYLCMYAEDYWIAMRAGREH